MDNPNGTALGLAEALPGAAAGASQADGWSRSARRRLTAAAVGGALVAAAGFGLAAAPIVVDSLLSLLSLLYPSAGVVMILAGAAVAVQAIRLLRYSGPQEPYRACNPAQLRVAFIAIWLGGTTIGLALAYRIGGNLRTSFIAATVAGCAMLAVAALWISASAGARFERRWPGAEESQPARRRPLRWSVFFACVWGMCSTVPAVIVEGLLIVLAFQVFQSRMSVTDLLLTGGDELLRDPLFLVMLIGGIVVVAPLIEEACKAAGLVLFRGAVRSHEAGLVVGLSIGLGFGLIESALYVAVILFAGEQIGLTAYLFVWWRVAAMWMHHLATGLAGAGAARRWLGTDRRGLRSGFGRAVLVHGGWNAIVIGLGLVEGGGVAGLLVLALMAPLLLLLGRTHSALVDRSIQEDHERGRVPLPSSWSPLRQGMWWRLAGGRPQYPPRPAGDAA